MAKLMGLFKLGLCTGLFVAGMTGCERAKQDVSSVSIRLPSHQKLQSLSASASPLKMKHLVINVTGSGISNPGYFMWSGCNDCSTVTPEPSDIQIEVPSGDSRLIQVLAVYDDVSLGKTVFFYGDITENLNGNKAVMVPVKDVMGSVDLASGQISGRLLDAADSGPSGVVNIKYQPPDNKPALLLEKSVISSGWFSFFALRGISLRYELENGRDLFGAALDLNSALVKDSKHVAKLYVPIRNEHRDGGVIAQTTEARISVLGYFGTAAHLQNKYVCHDVMDGSESPWRKYDNAAQSLSYAVQAVGSGEPPGLFDRENPPSVVTLLGGVFAQHAGCQNLVAQIPANIYQNFLFLQQGSLYYGESGFSGFRLPFAQMQMGSNSEYGRGSLMRATEEAGILRLSGRLLPGASSQIKKMKVFEMPLPSGGDFYSDKIACSDLEKSGNPLNAHLIGEGNVQDSGLFSVLTSQPITVFSYSSIFSFCSVDASGRTLATGSIIHGYDIENDYTPPIQHPYLRLEYMGGVEVDNNTTRVVGTNQCVQVQVKSYIGSGQPYLMPTALSLEVANPGFGQFYADANCMDSSNPVLEIPMNGNASDTFSFKASSIGIATPVNLNFTAGPTMTYDPAQNRVMAEAFEVRLDHSGLTSFSMGLGDCRLITAQLYLAGVPYNQVNLHAYPSINISPLNTLKAYQAMDTTCTGSSTSTLSSFPAGRAEFRIKAELAGQASVHLSATGNTLLSTPLTVTVP